MMVSLDLCHAPPTLTLVPNTSVNELEDPGVIEGSVWLEESLSACEELVIVCNHPGIAGGGH